MADDYDTETTTYDNPLAELLGVALSTLNSAADDIENARWPIIVVGIGGSSCALLLVVVAVPRVVAVARCITFLALLRLCFFESCLSRRQYTNIACCLLVGAMALGFLYIIFLRYCAGCLIWTTITAFILFLMGFAGYSWLMSGYFDTTSAAEWLSNFTSTVGLDAWSVAIDTWLNTTSFTSENVSVTSAYGIDVR